LRRIPEAQNMLAQLGYYSDAFTGVVDQRTRDALSRFQAANGLIATGDLNYDTFLQLQEKTRGYAPKRRVAENSNQFLDVPTNTLIVTKIPTNETASETPLGNADPTAVSSNPREVLNGNGGVLSLFGSRKIQKGDIVTIRSQSKKHDVGDKIIVDVTSNVSGFLTCFNQTQSGPITQIFPKNPDTAFAINADDPVSVPDKTAGFDIVIEKNRITEKILCAVEQSSAPADISDFVAKTALQPIEAKSFAVLKRLFEKASAKVHFAEIEFMAH